MSRLTPMVPLTFLMIKLLQVHPTLSPITQPPCHLSVATKPPPITRDVEVMTELPYADPPHSENDPAVPSTSLIPLVNAKDLATDIIGFKVSAHSETVKWSSGFTTLPESNPESSSHVVHIHHSDWISRPVELRDLISQMLREGKCIVLQALEKPQAARLDLDYLEDQGFSQFMHVSIHDMEEHTRDYMHPQLEGMIEDFLCNLCDPNCIQFILDLPYTGRGILDHLRQLDHGIAHGWNQTTTDYPIQDKVHPDNFLLNGWSLLHQPGVLTNFHHDLDGGVTFVHHAEIEANWHMEVVTLQEGDLLQYHAAYTPMESFAKGADCLNLEFLHHSELSQFVDVKKGHFLTNQVHEHSLETLEQMVIYLPRVSCRTNSHKYMAVGANKKKTLRNTTKPALAISRVIIKYFWKDLEMANSVYWFGSDKRHSSQSLMHPGELIDRKELAICLKPFTGF
ncbi:hypothetical protein F4604DRAFT_1684483 [Suillus subluteus]|nr:hypothetical protein F4604DRAFT_1684483 [Suillus subluteus]